MTRELPYQYENRSTAGQDLMQRAFDAPGNTVTLGADERPPEFRYTDEQVDHWVRFNDQAYRVTTGNRGLAATLDGPLGIAVALVGVGAAGFYGEDETESTG